MTFRTTVTTKSIRQNKVTGPSFVLDFVVDVIKSFFYSFTAPFTNMRIVKFKSQLTIAFFAAVNHLNGPPRKQNFTLTSSKGLGL